MPERIQMSRQKPWRADNPDAIIVSRPSHWSNPYTVEEYGRHMAVVMYRRDLANSILGPEVYDRIIAELRGHDLACWCKLSDECHADVLLELANEPVEG